MAQLGIRDKNYRPNQYINPMLIGMGREPNQEDAPYRIFDKSNPEHPDYDKDDDVGPQFEQLRLPIASIRPDQVRAVLSTGMFIGPRNEVYGRNKEGVWTPQGKFDNKIHGNIVPKNLFSQANSPMMIAKRKKSDEQRAYEDFVKDSQEAGFMEEANDSMRGRQGGGLDIMQDLLDIDGV